MNQLPEGERADWLIAALWNEHLELAREPALPPELDATATAERLFPGVPPQPIYKTIRHLQEDSCFENWRRFGGRWAVTLSEKGLEEGERQWRTQQEVP